MKAMIFAAGLGTRFKPWTDKHPKALALVNEKPLLQRNIEYLQQFGITDVVVNVHHYAEQIVQAVQQNKGWGSNITISDESSQVLETGGGLKKAKSFLEDDMFITLNVDILTNLNLKKFIHFHEDQQSLISLAVMDRKSTRNFLFDEGDRLCGWKNNSTGEERVVVSKANLIPKAYSGIAVFNPSIFPLMKQEGKFSLVEVYLSLADKYFILGYNHTEDKLIDVGKPESVAIAENLFP